jgi:hypothetical protein
MRAEKDPKMLCLPWLLSVPRNRETAHRQGHAQTLVKRWTMPARSTTIILGAAPSRFRRAPY